MPIVTFHQQIHAFLAILHTSGGIDSRTNLEDDIAHAQLSAVQTADVDDGFQSDARVGVEQFQAMESQDSVLIYYRHDICSNAHCTEVEQWDKSGERNVVVLGKGLHEFESHAASAEVLEWEWIIRALRVEYSHSGWHHVVGNMMVADDEVYAKAFGIFNLLDGLDAAIEDDDEFHTSFMCKVYSLFAYSIAFVISVGDVVIDVGIELLQKLIHQCYSRAAVYVVIAVNENALLASHGIVEAVYGDIHILHQERIDQVGKLWTEESLGCRLGRNASMDEKIRQDRADAELHG